MNETHAISPNPKSKPSDTQKATLPSSSDRAQFILPVTPHFPALVIQREPLFPRSQSSLIARFAACACIPLVGKSLLVCLICR